MHKHPIQIISASPGPPVGLSAQSLPKWIPADCTPGPVGPGWPQLWIRLWLISGAGSPQDYQHSHTMQESMAASRLRAKKDTILPAGRIDGAKKYSLVNHDITSLLLQLRE